MKHMRFLFFAFLLCCLCICQSGCVQYVHREAQLEEENAYIIDIPLPTDRPGEATAAPVVSIQLPPLTSAPGANASPVQTAAALTPSPVPAALETAAVPTQTPIETETPKPEETPEPVQTPKPTQTNEPIETPSPTPPPTPVPTPAPVPTPMPEPTLQLPQGMYFVEDESAGLMPVIANSGSTAVSEIFSLTNAQRSSNGMQPLSQSTTLMQAAATRAKELAISFSHTRPDGSSALSISSAAYAENIANGMNVSHRTIFDSWMQSSGHRKNILNASYRSIGIGFYSANGYNYYVQLFGY